MQQTGVRVSKRTIPILLLYLFINGLFVLKYVGRTQYSPLVALVFYIFATFFLFLSYRFIFRKSSKKLINSLIGLLAAITVFSILLLHHVINPDELNVDRWSAINNFIQNLLIGVYPYSAQTHLGGYGSPFPVWQFFHIPFYLLGNISLGMLFSFGLLVFVLVRFSNNAKSTLLFLLLLMLSPAFWYEVTARSDLFYNFLILFIFIFYIHKKGYTVQKNVFLLGVFCGLFLSTRLTTSIPLFLYLFIDFLKSEMKYKATFILLVIATFVISFLPLLFWDFESLLFFKHNPFILQTRQGSLIQVSIFGALIVFLSLIWKNSFLKYNELTAYVLTILVAVTFILRLFASNFTDSIFSSAYDITYFNMALPFILYHLSVGDSIDGETDIFYKNF